MPEPRDTEPGRQGIASSAALAPRHGSSQTRSTSTSSPTSQGIAGGSASTWRADASDALREENMERKRMESAADLATSIGKFYVQAFTQPMTALGGSLAVSREMLKSLTGQSEIEPDKSDKRFKDPVWTSNPGYRFLMQSYLVWSGAITGWVDSLNVPERDKLRVKLLANLLTDALAPTNALLTNPTAMKATLDTGGKNLVAGLRHLMHDMTANNGLPSMVDKSKFQVGKNLGKSEG